MNTIPPLAYVVAGIVILIAMARFIPQVAGWLLLALVLGLLLSAQRKGLLT